MSESSVTYRLAALGDAMLGRTVGERLKESPSLFLLEDIRGFLEEFDLTCINLECPCTTKGDPYKFQDPHVTFRCNPNALDVVQHLGRTTIVSLANNHMLDYGQEALLDTLTHLDANNIKYVGAGRNYEEANRPLLLACNGHKIAVFAYVFIYSASTTRATKNKPGVSDHRIKRILSRIKYMKNAGYSVIISVHWGVERSFYPLPYQMVQARKMIDAGASVILGHGPHYPQGIENYKHGKIVYSLGNFIFDEPHIFSNRSFIFTAELNGNGDFISSSIVPFQINNCVPSLIKGIQKYNMHKFIVNLNKYYNKKNNNFWKKQNSNYFSDIISRVVKMKSIKFIFLPPLSFYFDIGIVNFMKKFTFRNLISISDSLLRSQWLSKKSSKIQ